MAEIRVGTVVKLLPIYDDKNTYTVTAFRRYDEVDFAMAVTEAGDREIMAELATLEIVSGT